jgi:secreted trypsin-like serine protease
MLAGGLAVIGLVTATAPGSAAAPSARTAPSLAPRIINGAQGDPAQFPFLVSLLSNERLKKYNVFEAQFCAGTLTTPLTVVTAAHCVVDQDSGIPTKQTDMSIGIGANLRAADLRIVEVASVAPNPNYSRRSRTNDIAVITLKAPLNDVGLIRPLTPAESPAYTAEGAPLTVAGWGNMSTTTKNFPDVFQSGALVAFPDSTCGASAPYTLNGVPFRGFDSSEADPASMLCAGGVTADGQRIDSCQGDSGGPLIGGAGPDARLVGVVSWGNDCAENFPGVYTRVSAENEFLASQGAIPGPVPVTPPAMLIEPQSSAVRIAFAPPQDGSLVTAYGATIQDPVTGQVVTCFASARSDGVLPACLAGGLTNATAYNVTAIQGSALGNSPVSAPVPVTPLPVPTPGRIRSAEAFAGGTAVLRVTRSFDNGSPLLAERVVCLPVSGGLPRVAKVTGRDVIVKRYSCVLQARNAVGTGRSLPFGLTGKR